MATVVTRAAESATGPTPRSRLHALAEAYRAWAVRQPHRYLLVQGTPVPGYTAPADTVERARAALGSFLGVFATASPTAAVLPVVEEMDSWARRDDAVVTWVTTHAGERAAAAPVCPWRAPCSPGPTCTAPSAWRRPASSRAWATAAPRS